MLNAKNASEQPAKSIHCPCILEMLGNRLNLRISSITVESPHADLYKISVISRLTSMSSEEFDGHLLATYFFDPDILLVGNNAYALVFDTDYQAPSFGRYQIYAVLSHQVNQEWLVEDHIGIGNGMSFNGLLPSVSKHTLITDGQFRSSSVSYIGEHSGYNTGRVELDVGVGAADVYFTALLLLYLLILMLRSRYTDVLRCLVQMVNLSRIHMPAVVWSRLKVGEGA